MLARASPSPALLHRPPVPPAIRLHESRQLPNRPGQKTGPEDQASLALNFHLSSCVLRRRIGTLLASNCGLRSHATPPPRPRAATYLRCRRALHCTASYWPCHLNKHRRSGRRRSSGLDWPHRGSLYEPNFICHPIHMLPQLLTMYFYFQPSRAQS